MPVCGSLVVVSGAGMLLAGNFHRIVVPSLFEAMEKLLFSFVFLFVSLSLLAQQAPVHKITYEAFTRGYQKAVEITPDSILIEESGTKSGKIKQALQPGEWKQLMRVLEGIAPSDLPQMNATGDNRARDAALHATLTITTDAGSYTSPTFNNYRAHPRLEPLMEFIRKMEEEAGKK